jgi:hypothetical protein
MQRVCLVTTVNIYKKLFKFHCRLNGINMPEFKTPTMKEKAHAAFACDAKLFS